MWWYQTNIVKYHHTYTGILLLYLRVKVLLLFVLKSENQKLKIKDYEKNR